MSQRDIIVLGASAGGVEALTQIVQHLPADLPASLFVVLHVPPFGSSVLPDILRRKGPLPVCHAADGQAIERGRIYVAPPDRHLIVKDGVMRVTRGPNENGHRPSIDPLFRSAARSYGPRVIAVVLTGMLDDGTAGLQAVKLRGGTALVQDPKEAMFAGMPRNAVENVAVDWILPLAEIAPALVRLAQEPPEKNMDFMASPQHKEDMAVEADIAEMDMAALEQDRAGQPSGFTCPECHGALWETQDGELIRFRCRVGHAYSPDSLLADQSEALEDALWIALRALEESAALADRLQKRAGERGHNLASSRFGQQAQDARERAQIVRQALLHKQKALEEDPLVPERAPSQEDRH